MGGYADALEPNGFEDSSSGLAGGQKSVEYVKYSHSYLGTCDGGSDANVD